jgi:hypothetical protein
MSKSSGSQTRQFYEQENTNLEVEYLKLTALRDIREILLLNVNIVPAGINAKITEILDLIDAGNY